MRRAPTSSRSLVIGLTAFLTVVDLFATQAILPSLAKAYGVSPAAMGFAVNASTIGMAVAGLAVALLQPPHRPPRGASSRASRCCRSRRRCWRWRPISRRSPSLRVVQGLLHGDGLRAHAVVSRRGTAAPAETAGAFAAYITGNVASNLFGRLMSAALADHLGLAGNFIVFAALNLAGAALV